MSMKFLNTIAVDTDVLYVDTVNDRVGVGTISPTADLHVQGSSATNVPIIRSGGFGNSGSKLELAETLTNGDMNYGFSFFNDGNSSNTLKIKAHNNSTAGVTAITIGRTNALTTFSTVPIVGTRTAGDNSTYAASTAFVAAAVAAAPQGDITSVVAGTGLTGGGTTGAVTLNAIGGDGITANANDIAVDATVVRTTGTQSITGAKSFSEHVTIEGTTKNLYILNDAETQAGIVFGDTQGGTSQRAAIKFDSSTETLDFFVNDEANERMSINTAGTLTLNAGQIVLSGTGRIQGVDTVSASTDAANKAYVDNAVSAPTAPAAPTTVTTTVVGETIEVTFNESATSDIDYYQVWSADPSGNFGIIAQIAQGDFASTMTVVDTSFNVSGTISYRVYAVKLGIYSTAATSTQAFLASALSVTAMTVVNLNTAYYVQYEKPSSRFIDNIEIYMDSQTTQAALSRSNASIVYSGQNASYMRSVGVSNNFHQFWVEVTTT